MMYYDEMTDVEKLGEKHREGRVFVHSSYGLGIGCLWRCTARRHRQLAEVVWRYGHGWIGQVGLRGSCQAAVAVPVTSFQVVNRSAISHRYSSAPSR
jgi:hypothetical protein